MKEETGIRTLITLGVVFFGLVVINIIIMTTSMAFMMGKRVLEEIFK